MQLLDQEQLSPGLLSAKRQVETKIENARKKQAAKLKKETQRS